tara:strand:- start:16405 stop:17193 length:789 start_codon:yes stop_codon:yes gene_type:complete
MIFRFIFCLLLCFSCLSHAQEQSLISKIRELCGEGNIAFLSQENCLRFNNTKFSVAPLHFHARQQLSVQAMHVHLPSLKVIEEEDDFLNDNIYMWFIITVDGVPYSKVTEIYRNLDEGDILNFNHVDRVINNLNYTRQLIIDWGIVESDGDDISRLQEISKQTLQLVRLIVETQPDSSRAQLLLRLGEQTAQVMSLLMGLDHDDKLVSGTMILDSQSTSQTVDIGGLKELIQDFKGAHLGSDWHYQLRWRFLMVDISPPALF